MRETDPSDCHVRRRTISRAALENRPEVPSGRRSQSRLRVRLPARIETLAEDFQVILADLSGNGARFLTDARLPPGSEVVLAWGRHEAFGEVVWCAHNQCGLAFVEPLDRRVLLDTRALNDAAQLPDDRAMLKQIASQWVRGVRRL
ncbi:PilZ domain-containing protein [Novosphingobium sp. MBES04]|uniref:PilZ domain-containing protein n=1 Tax=Novosphingobium sp. MBES04 TaxID=1206458 RepID=UPI00072340ED|nr:PilZ domain-containing protein [Novosphingobium sp. MBES04]GAM05455.1 hypothetical conserved protein [Novosphingobium sp. MBES04]